MKVRLVFACAALTLSLLIAGLVAVGWPGGGVSATIEDGPGGRPPPAAISPLETITISGTVRGPGGPLPGVLVRASSPGGSWVEDVTDAAGHYSVSLEFYGQLWMRVRPDVSLRLSWQDYDPDGVSGSFTQDFNLVDGYLLRVRLVDGDGDPITQSVGQSVVPLKTILDKYWNQRLDWDPASERYQAVLPPDVHYLYLSDVPPGYYDTMHILDLRSADLDADLELNPGYVPPVPYDPPDPSLISVGGIDDLGEAPVTGDPGAALPLAHVLVVNLHTGHQADTHSAEDGSFATQIFAPPGSALLVRHGAANRLWDSLRLGAAGDLGKFPGTILHVPYPTSAPDAQPFAVLGSAAFFADYLPETLNWVGVSWTVNGAVSPVTPGADPRHYDPGDAYRVAGLLRIYGPGITATTPISGVQVFGAVTDRLLFDAEGHQIPGNWMMSARLTPTGLTVEGGRNADAWDATPVLVSGLHIAGPHVIEGDLHATVTLPPDLPAGTYRPMLGLFVSGVPTSTQWVGVQLHPCQLQDRSEVLLPPITVGDAAPPRLSSYMLVDPPAQALRGFQGLRGTRARQDAAIFGLAPEIVTQGAPLVVPPADEMTGEPITYHLDPYFPALGWAPKMETCPPPLPFELPSGFLETAVRRPDGTVQALGPASFQRSSSRIPTTRSGLVVNPGTVRVDNVYSLMAGPAEVTLEQPGHYVITTTGFVADIWGNPYSVDGTYDVWAGYPLDMDPGVLPGTPFQVGDTFNPSLQLEPAVPADVQWQVLLYPNSDPALAITHTVAGQANRFGYFAGAPFPMEEPGEFRVDLTAVYTDAEGQLHMGTMRWGSVVETPGSPLEAHGRRGLDNLGYIAPAWFVNSRDLTIPPDIQHIMNAYYNGDMIWSRLFDPTVTGGDSLTLMPTVRDTQGEIEAAIVARAERCGLELIGPGTLSERVAAGELPLFYSTSSCRADQLAPQDIDQIAYSYRSSQRPGVRVREEVSQESRMSGYWRLDTLYEGQLSVGIEGDLPNDFKFQYAATVFHDFVTPTHQYNIQGSGWVYIPDEDTLGSRVMPPFAGPGNGGWTTEGGPIMTLKGQEVHIFIMPTGTSPGQVLQVGDVFRMAGHLMPTLDSSVAYTVTSPGGTQRLGGGQANKIGYFYDPGDDFVVDEPGLWTVDLRVWHDGACSGGQTVPPYPQGDLLGSENGRFWFYVVEPSAPRLHVAAPTPGFLNFYGGVRPITVTGTLPAGLSGATLDYTIRMPGFILEHGQVTVAGGSYQVVFDPVALAAESPNLDLIAREDLKPGLADTFVISLLLRGQQGAEAVNRANLVVLQGDQVLVDPGPEELPGYTVYLPLVGRGWGTP